MTSSSTDVDILIVGAGPVGLTAALEAKRLGFSYRILERKESRHPDTRALVFHPRVMELVSPNEGLVEKLNEAGFHGEGTNIFLPGGKSFHTSAKDQVMGDTAHPYVLFIPQNETIRCLEETLKERGGPTVEFGKSLDTLEQTPDMVTSKIRHNNTDPPKYETITSKYVIGCDGGRSRTREMIGATMPRTHDDDCATVAFDFKFTSPNPPMEQKQVNIFMMSMGGVCFVLPMPGEHCYRLLASPAPCGITLKTDVTVLDHAMCEKVLREGTGLLTDKFDMELCHWKSIFGLTHGLATSLNKGRVFLTGDASHVHSPVGGQGMNYGMQDAHNLIWKIKWHERACKAAAAASDNCAPSGVILRSFSEERHAFGNHLIKGVHTMTNIVTTLNPIAMWVRDALVPYVFANMKPYLYRTLGELNQNFDPSWSTILFSDPSSKSSFGGLFSCGDDNKFICKSGQRLPNIKLSSSKETLHELVDREQHTWVFLNYADVNIETIAPQGTHLKMVQATPAPEEAQVSYPVIPQSNLEKAQVVLVRPDLWVAGVAETFDELWKQVTEVLDAHSASIM